jgi:hypothetical protein
MKKDKQKLEESLARRYMTLSGIPLLEEAEAVDPEETREDAFAGGDNLVQPIDHAKVTSEESNVKGVEAASPTTGEVSVVSESKLLEIIEKVKEKIQSNQG